MMVPANDDVFEAESFRSFRPRRVELVLRQDGELGPQRNRGEETRHKVTQRDFDGGGVIGWIDRVCYGHCSGKTACVVVFRFSFRGNETIGAFTKAEVEVTFEPYTKRSKREHPNDVSPPVVRNVAPGYLRGRPDYTGQTWRQDIVKSCSGDIKRWCQLVSDGSKGQEPHRLLVKGSIWSSLKKTNDKACLVVEESNDFDSPSLGVPEDINFAVLVESEHSFQAHVKVKTYTSERRFRADPWRKDDPVLFVGMGSSGSIRGDPVSTFEFEALSVRDWNNLILDDEPQAKTATSVTKPKSKTAVSTLQDVTYRVEGLPKDLALTEVHDLLQKLLQADEDVKLSLKIRSLATNDRFRGEQIATIAMSSPYNKLQKGQRRTFELPSDGEYGSSTRHQIVMDDAFVGITILCNPQEEAAVDIVALSGLGAHSFGSFKERGGNHVWLIDDLPFDFLDARLMTYGYETALLHSKSFQDFEALASTLISALKSVRRESWGVPSTRPLIFIAHSLGGLLLKKALIRMTQGSDYEESCIAQSTAAILFFGVPNLGMNVGPLRWKVEGQPNEFFLQQLRQGSDVLRELNRDFCGTFTSSHCRIESFYETEVSPTAKRGEDGEGRMDGPEEVMVTQDSAIAASRNWESDPVFHHALKKNHSELVKFSVRDEQYLVVKEVLDRLMRRIRSEDFS